MFSSIVLVCSPIIFTPIAIAVKLSSPGPVFFKQKRTGFKGKEFNCYKFRTMKVNANSDQLQENGKTTIFQVIAGDHFIRYDLKTKQGKIDVEVSSFKWKEDTWQETYYHEFRARL